MAWSSKTQITNAVTVDSTTLQDASTAVTLNPGESAHVQAYCDFGTTPTGHMEVHVFATLDDSSELWDTTAYGLPYTILNSIDQNYVSFIVTGVYKFRLMYKNSAGTTSNAVSAWYRKDGISL